MTVSIDSEKVTQLNMLVDRITLEIDNMNTPISIYLMAD